MISRAGLGQRGAHLREIAVYVRPHLMRQRGLVAVGTVLAFASAVFGMMAALLLASMLEIVRGGPPEARSFQFSWSKILDLNTAGEQVTGLVGSFLPITDSPNGAILLLGTFLLVSTTLTVACNLGSKRTWMAVRTRVAREMQLELFAHVLALPMSFHVKSPSGSVLARLHGDVNGVASMIPALFHTLLRAPFVVGGSILVLLRTSVPLTAITLTAAAAYLGANFFLGRLVRQSYLRQSRYRASLMALATEALMAVRIVKAFSAERAEIQDMRSQLKVLVHEEIRGDLLSTHVPAALNQLLSAASAVVVVITGLSMVASGDITAQGMAGFMIVSFALLLTSSIAAQAVLTVFMLSASAGRVLELWRERSDLVEGTRTATSLREGLTLRHVSFAYSGEPVLSDVEMTIAKGERIGIAGPSGAGKSTLADLVLRLYDPSDGVIELDGIDIREFTNESYRRLFGIVPQENLLFNDTIRKNIAYGRRWLTHDEIVAAAKTANIHAFIMSLPDGYDTIVGERGTRLSGGERQRIAIARAVVSRPQILIFDEATSSLDNESERLVRDAIERVTEDSTAIIIAHRISTIQNCDRIVVLEAGRIVETGRHEELLRRGAVYRRLYEAGSVEVVADETDRQLRAELSSR